MRQERLGQQAGEVIEVSKDQPLVRQERLERLVHVVSIGQPWVRLEQMEHLVSRDQT